MVSPGVGETTNVLQQSATHGKRNSANSTRDRIPWVSYFRTLPSKLWYATQMVYAYACSYLEPNYFPLLVMLLWLLGSTALMYSMSLVVLVKYTIDAYVRYETIRRIQLYQTVHTMSIEPPMDL